MLTVIRRWQNPSHTIVPTLSPSTLHTRNKHARDEQGLASNLCNPSRTINDKWQLNPVLDMGAIDFGDDGRHFVQLFAVICYRLMLQCNHHQPTCMLTIPTPATAPSSLPCAPPHSVEMSPKSTAPLLTTPPVLTEYNETHSEPSPPVTTSSPSATNVGW